MIKPLLHVQPKPVESDILTLLHVSVATEDRTGLVINGSFP